MDKHKLIQREFQTCHVVCNKTGISYTMQQPKSIFGMSFEQKHPLANISEAVALAKCSFAQHKQCDSSILAGAILTIFADKSLRNDKLSSREANIYLSAKSVHVLSSTLHFLTSISDRIYKKLPRIAISEEVQLDAWLWACRGLINAPIQRTEKTEPIVKLKSQLLIHSIEPETRKIARKCLEQIKELISPKLHSILKISQSGNTMATMGDALRENLIKALNSYELPAATKLAQILHDCKANSSVQESITRRQLDSFETFSTTVTEFKKPKLSVAEMLAAKINGTLKATAQESLESLKITEVNGEVDIYVSSISPIPFNPIGVKELTSLIHELHAEVEQELSDIEEFNEEPNIHAEVEEIDLEDSELDSVSFSSYQIEETTGECHDLPNY